MTVMPVGTILIDGAKLCSLRELTGWESKTRRKPRQFSGGFAFFPMAAGRRANVVGRRDVEVVLRRLPSGGLSNGPCPIVWHWKERPWMKETHGLQKHGHRWLPLVPFGKGPGIKCREGFIPSKGMVVAKGCF